jgi:hypothetical protein
MREAAMKSYTRDEFVDYVKTLEFDVLEDAASFITEYYNYYNNLPDEKKEEKDAAYEKYIILMSKFGMMFVTFTSLVIEFRKKLNEDIQAEEDSRSGSLGEGTE